MDPQPDLQSRYAGNPLLRLLDAYVLWCLGSLPPDQEALLQQMTPHLQQTWKRSEKQWHEVLAAQMQLPANMPDLIRENWQKNQVIAAANKVTLTPLSFTHLFVDENFGLDS